MNKARLKEVVLKGHNKNLETFMTDPKNFQPVQDS